jgi:hypothetical protein
VRLRQDLLHVISGVVRIGDQEVKAGDALVFEDKATIHAIEDTCT